MRKTLALLALFVVFVSVPAAASAKSGPAVNTYILLDRTGSMSGIWDEALGSVNAYAADLGKTAPGDKDLRASLTLAVFDHQNGLQFDVLRNHVTPADWKQVTPLEAGPRGMTPLYDAIGRIVSLAETDNPKKAVIVIMTDGEENASREVTNTGARAALDRARARGWEVVFLGADFAKFTDAEAVGVSSAQTMAVDKDGMKDTMQRLAKKSRDYGQSDGKAPVTFTNEDRAAANEAAVKAKQ